MRLELQGKSVIKTWLQLNTTERMAATRAWAAKSFSESTWAADAASRRVLSDPPSQLPHSHPSLCATQSNTIQLVDYRKTVQLMDFWEESRGGNIGFFDLYVALICSVAADLQCWTKDKGWKGWRGGGEWLLLLEIVCILRWNYIGFFVAAIPGQFTPMVSNLPTMQMSWRAVHKVGWGPNSYTKLLVNPSFCSVTVH